MKHQNLQIRTKQFALEVIKFTEGLPKDDTSRILGRQLIDQYGKAKLRGARIIAIQRKNVGREDYALCTLHFAFESFPAHAISTKNKHLLLSHDTNPRFHGGSFGV